MKLTIEKDIMVPMRDNVSLATDIYRPDTNEPLPTLIRRLPYNKNSTKYISSPEILKIVQAGYIYVVQDVRGTASSEGEFIPFFQEPEDGEDLINWVRQQPWCNGKIGMIGRSYHGATQLFAAQKQPDGLCVMITEVTPADAFEGLTYRGGALQLAGATGWATRMFNNHVLSRYVKQDKNKIAFDVDSLPLVNTPLAKAWKVYKDWLNHPSYDDYWKTAAIREHYDKVTVPVLHIGGWYDIFLNGTLDNYQGITKRGGSQIGRQNQRLVIGPWTHRVKTGVFPERTYGSHANRDAFITQLHLDWFDRWLKGKDFSNEPEKPVKIFVMGIDSWRDEEDWPLPDTKYKKYYLRSNGKANTANGDGNLSLQPPENEPEDTYRYDPSYPVPTFGGALQHLECRAETEASTVILPAEYSAGPRDQLIVEKRKDVLCYTTNPLEASLEVTGPIQLVLYISSSAVDTDFTGKLVDVYPDGRAEILSEGILRTRYRDSMSDPELMEPNKKYKLVINIGATSNVFRVGHRIRLEVSSSNFPLYDRNSNTGGVIAEESSTDFIVAENKVFHNQEFPSHLILPIIDRE